MYRCCSANNCASAYVHILCIITKNAKIDGGKITLLRIVYQVENYTNILLLNVFQD